MREMSVDYFSGCTFLDPFLGPGRPSPVTQLHVPRSGPLEHLGEDAVLHVVVDLRERIRRHSELRRVPPAADVPRALATGVRKRDRPVLY